MFCCYIRFLDICKQCALKRHFIEHGGGHEGSSKRKCFKKTKGGSEWSFSWNGKSPPVSPLRGFSVISPLCDVSIHAANIHVPHCNGCDEVGLYDRWSARWSVSWRTTCPCPRRRRESEVLVGCFVASVSEVSLAFCCEERLKQSQCGNSGRINFDTCHAVTAAETLCRVNMEVITENMDEGNDFYIRDNSFICIGSIQNWEDIFFLFKTLLSTFPPTSVSELYYCWCKVVKTSHSY